MLLVAGKAASTQDAQRAAYGRRGMLTSGGASRVCPGMSYTLRTRSMAAGLLVDAPLVAHDFLAAGFFLLVLGACNRGRRRGHVSAPTCTAGGRAGRCDAINLLTSFFTALPLLCGVLAALRGAAIRRGGCYLKRVQAVTPYLLELH